MVSDIYLAKWQQIPRAVKQFLLKALLLLVIWKVVYLCFFFPGRVLDAPLTKAVGIGTVKFLNLFGSPTDYAMTPGVQEHIVNSVPVIAYNVGIYFHGLIVCTIEDVCNGLELMILYIGFIICVPAALGRKLLFILLGTIAIYIINVLRCAAVTYLFIFHPRHADFAHHYLFAFIVYAFIIGLWLLYTNKLTIPTDNV